MTRAIENGATQCSPSLVAGEEDSTLLAPEVVFEMVLDPTGLTHTAAADDHTALLAVVEGNGVGDIDDGDQGGKENWIDSPIHQLHCLIIHITKEVSSK